MYWARGCCASVSGQCVWCEAPQGCASRAPACGKERERESEASRAPTSSVWMVRRHRQWGSASRVPARLRSERCAGTEWQVPLWASVAVAASEWAPPCLLRLHWLANRTQVDRCGWAGNSRHKSQGEARKNAPESRSLHAGLWLSSLPTTSSLHTFFSNLVPDKAQKIKLPSTQHQQPDPPAKTEYQPDTALTHVFSNFSLELPSQ